MNLQDQIVSHLEFHSHMALTAEVIAEDMGVRDMNVINAALEQLAEGQDIIAWDSENVDAPTVYSSVELGEHQDDEDELETIDVDFDGMDIAEANRILRGARKEYYNVSSDDFDKLIAIIEA